jgi:HSP20 family molecular chaperone IbpA
LPAPVLAEHAQAELKNGILELKLPKAEKPKQITVAAA